MSTLVNRQIVARSGVLVIEKDAAQEAAALEQQANIEVERASQAVVLSQGDYDRECLEMVRLGELIKEAHARFDPICTDTDRAHKTACSQRSIVLTPLERAKSILGSKVGAFLVQLERAEEERQRQESERARHQAELDREAEIEHFERTGAAPEEVAALCERPLDALPVISRPAIPRGPVSARDNYKGRVTNLLTLVQHVAKHPEHIGLLQADESAINRLAKALKTAMRIPGIEVYNEVGTSTRTAPPRGAR